jgi:hypothetical protein
MELLVRNAWIKNNFENNPTEFLSRMKEVKSLFDKHFRLRLNEYTVRKMEIKYFPLAIDASSEINYLLNHCINSHYYKIDKKFRIKKNREYVKNFRPHFISD